MATTEQARIDAVRELGLLDTPPEERFDRVVRLAKRLFDVPTVLVNLIDDDRLFVKSAVGADAGTSVPIDIAFCSRTVQTREALVVNDARADSAWADNPLVTGDPGIVFYAAWPLSGPGGQVVGALCLVDQQPRELSHGDAALLDDLARWVETELAADADAIQAMEIQRRLLPHKPPDVLGYDVAGRCQPAFNVGGDYYDWHLLDDTMLQVTVADVMGKGLAAGMIAAGLRTAMRVTSRAHTLMESVRRTAEGLQDDFDVSGTFATMFSARLRPQHGHLEYVDAGHGLALHFRPGGRTRQLTARDLPLGAQAGSIWTSHEARLEPGDTLIVVSDGVLEAFTEPIEALRAAEQLVATSQTADEMADRILAAAAYAPLADDLTAVVVRRDIA
ncbi:MAG TPA: SpoIIE family protein phosphatase [Nocardioides sp.]|nr:SpoIIE family protein phosphatase [Nocardioides sp.]